MVFLDQRADAVGSHGQKSVYGPQEGNTLLLLEVQQEDGCQQQHDAHTARYCQRLSPHGDAEEKGDDEGEGRDDAGHGHGTHAQGFEAAVHGKTQKRAVGDAHQAGGQMEGQSGEQAEQDEHEHAGGGFADVEDGGAAALHGRLLAQGRLARRADNIQKIK